MKGVAGTGSTVAVLVFSVLCLTIFSMIALMSASADKSLAEAAAHTVVGYYEADMLAELIISDIADYKEIPGDIRGIPILNEGSTLSFACPVSDNKELYVEIELFEDTRHITEWRMRRTQAWENDGSLPVWSGDEP